MNTSNTTKEKQNLPLSGYKGEDLVMSKKSTEKVSRTRKCCRCQVRKRLNDFYGKRFTCTTCLEMPIKCIKCNTIKDNNEFGRRQRTCRYFLNLSRRVKRREQDWFSYIYDLARHRSKRKGLLFEISIDDIRDVWEKQDGRCAVTGEKMQKIVDRDNLQTGSIDQISPGCGYTKYNIQMVTMWANRAKTSLSQEDFNQKIINTFKFIQKNLPPVHLE